MRNWFVGWRWFWRGPRPRPRCRPIRLCVEQLGDRCLLSGFVQTNLVSDIPGLARFTDPNLINPWGLASGPAAPFWVADAYTGVSTLYDGGGDPLSIGRTSAFAVPVSGGGLGTPTGVVFNGSSGFDVSDGWSAFSALFLFATEDGTIDGWSPAFGDGGAVVAVNHSADGAVYKGLALGTDSHGHTFLYAANFAAGTVDVFDQDFQAVVGPGAFQDPNLPAGYAPFGIQNLDGQIYVTYALQDAARQDDVPGAGHGFVDVFSLDGRLEQRLVSQGPLDSPWGLALAPSSFRAFGGDLLVGNTGDGRISVFSPRTGAFLGQLADAHGNPIAIDHLWGLQFGNGAEAGGRQTLYFTAGIADERHGLFGSLRDAQGRPDPFPGVPAGGVYHQTPPTGSSHGKDTYPVPPAGTPGPRGEVTVQPRPLAIPLRDPPPGLAPTLVTISERSGTSAVTPPVAVTPPASGPTASPGRITDGAGTDPSWADRPGALAMLLSLEGLPGAGGPITITAADRDIAYPSSETGDLSEDGGALVLDKQRAAPPAAATEAPGGRHLAGQASRGTYALAALLIAGGVFLTWGVEYVARKRQPLSP